MAASITVHLQIFKRPQLPHFSTDLDETGTRVGISGTTAKLRQRKFVPSSHPGPFALVASSHKSQTKVGTLACFDFL